MRLCGLIEGDETLKTQVAGRSLLSHQVEMFKRYGIEDIFVFEDEDIPGLDTLCKKLECKEIGEREARTLNNTYDGIFFIGGNMFVEEGLLLGFSPEGPTTFIDSAKGKRPNLAFYTKKKEKERAYDLKGKIWTKIEKEEDILYAEKGKLLYEKRAEVQRLRLFSFDLDGTTILGKRPIEGVVDFLLYLKSQDKGFSFLTNNSSRTNSMHAKHLTEILGIPVRYENIMSSIDSLEIYLKERGITSIYPFVNNDVKAYLGNRIRFSEEEPDVVVVGFNTDATYNQMYKVSELIFKGIPYILIHPDYRCPTEFGYIPDAGSFGKMFELTTDKKPIWIGGKPNPVMVDGLVNKYGIPKEEIAYVGDRLYTDIEMAKRAHIYGFLVLTGETSLRDFYLYTRENGTDDRIFVIDNLKFLKAFLEREY